MAEYLTKTDMLQHEKEASKRRDQIAEKEQTFRHELRNKVQKDYDNVDKRVEGNNKELALLKQSHHNMTEKVTEIKEEMKEGFNKMEKQMEDFLRTIKDGYATKQEHDNNSRRISFIERGIWGVIGTAGLGIIAAILKLIIT